jgi:hypothetical protein
VIWVSLEMFWPKKITPAAVAAVAAITAALFSIVVWVIPALAP